MGFPRVDRFLGTSESADIAVCLDDGQISIGEVDQDAARRDVDEMSALMAVNDLALPEAMRLELGMNSVRRFWKLRLEELVYFLADSFLPRPAIHVLAPDRPMGDGAFRAMYNYVRPVEHVHQGIQFLG